MVFKVDKIYRVKASRFYQILAAATEHDEWCPGLTLTIFTLFLAEEDDDLVFETKLGCLSEAATYDGICETDLRLRSRCGSLLETQFGKSSLKEIQSEMTVYYIHRTVKDYLDSTGIRYILLDRTGGLSAGSFNPNIALMRAYILRLKALKAVKTNLQKAKELMEAFITYARRADRDLCEPNTELMDEFCMTRKTWLEAAGLSTESPNYSVKTQLQWQSKTAYPTTCEPN